MRTLQWRRRAEEQWASEELEEKTEDDGRRGIGWQRIVQRDRQLRGAVLLQRSIRRYLNQTYDREHAARTLQAFARKYVLCHQRRRDTTSGVVARRRIPERDERDRRLENATIKPLTPRRQGGGGGGYGVFGGGGGRGGRGRGMGSDGQEDRRRSGDSDRQQPQLFAEVTRSTAPLTSSDVSVLQDFHFGSSTDSSSSSSSDGACSYRRRRREPVAGLALQYDVFLWHDKQHALELAPCAVSRRPCVADASRANVSLPGMWHVRDGDILLSINGCSTHERELTFGDVVQVLDSGVRPAILRFRRPSREESKARARGATTARRERPGGSNGSASSTHNRHQPVLMPSGFTSTSASTRRDVLRQQERSEASLCFVVWREEVPELGIHLKQRMGKPYPEVATVAHDDARAASASRETLAPPVQPGDWLLSVNDWSVREAKIQHVLQVLRYSPRPLILTFRRIQQPKSPGQRTVDL